MIKISQKYKKIQLIWMRVMFLFAIGFVFMMPGVIAVDNTEKNYFTIYLNDEKIGKRVVL